MFGEFSTVEVEASKQAEEEEEDVNCLLTLSVVRMRNARKILTLRRWRSVVVKVLKRALNQISDTVSK